MKKLFSLFVNDKNRFLEKKSGHRLMKILFIISLIGVFGYSLVLIKQNININYMGPNRVISDDEYQDDNEKLTYRLVNWMNNGINDYNVDEIGQHFPSLKSNAESWIDLQKDIKNNGFNKSKLCSKYITICNDFKTGESFYNNRKINWYFLTIANYIIIGILALVTTVLSGIIIQYIYYKGVIYIIYGKNNKGK